METTVAPPAAPPDLPVALTIGGRTFRRAASTTVDQDAYVTKRLRDSGLYAILDAFDPRADDLSALNERIIWEAYERGVMYEVLAGILVEEGVPWSRSRAIATAQAIKDISDPVEKAAILASAADFLFDFFSVAAAWSSRSGNSTPSGTASGGTSDRNADDNAPAIAQATERPIAPSPLASGSVAPTSTTSANGTN